MGYLDSAGLAHFADWVKSRLSGKQDRLTPDSTIALQDGRIAVSVTPEMRRVWFRGQRLGGSFTAQQQSAVRDGSFDGLFLGDYWEIGGVRWRIADMDYWLGCGNPAFAQHHLLILPDTALYSARMNGTSDTAGGYVNSEMRLSNLEQAREAVSNAFGDALLTHKEYLVNAASGGRPSGVGWYDSGVDLLSEAMLYGSRFFAYANSGVIPNIHTINKSQLALFQAAPKFMLARDASGAGSDTWLRDVVSSSNFAVLNIFGCASSINATLPRFVRPVFAIG